MKARESYLNLLEEQMKENYQKFAQNSMTAETNKRLNEVIHCFILRVTFFLEKIHQMIFFG